MPALKYEQILERAIDQYVDTLAVSPQVGDSFVEHLRETSLEELLRSVDNLQNRFAENTKYKRLLDRVYPCVEMLQRFTSVIDTSVQSNPELSALIWGGLKLLLQLASDFKTFFDKLVRMIEQMSNALPDYALYLEHFSTDDKLIRHIVSAYVDILEFYRQATAVFLKHGNKKARNSISVGAKILWKPFDLRFKEIVDRFQDNCVFVERRVRALECREKAEDARRLANQLDELMDEVERGKTKTAEHERRAAKWARKAKEYEQAAAEIERSESGLFRERFYKLEQHLWETMKTEERATRDLCLLNIRGWLNPFDCEEVMSNLARRHHPKTGEHIFANEVYRNWMKAGTGNDEKKGDSTDRLLWIKGKPGAGKTFLNVPIIEDIKGTKTATGASVAYFFCSWMDKKRSKLRTVLASLVYQLLVENRDHPELMDAFAIANLESKSPVCSSVDELWEYLSLLTKLCSFTIIVVDGVDELSLEDPGWAAEGFSKIVEASPTTRVLVFGRDSNAGLCEHLGTKYPSIHLNEDKNRGDIRAYVSSKVGGILELGIHDAPLAEEMVDHLVARSVGMFLWAKLVLDILSSKALSVEQRTLLYNNLTYIEGLDALYTRIMELISYQMDAEKRLARKIIALVLQAREPITVAELNIAVSQGNAPLKKWQLINELPSICSVVCGGLVELKADEYVSFIHTSVVEFLDTRRSTYGLQESDAANADLASTCLRYMTITVPPQPLAGELHAASGHNHDLTDGGNISRKYLFLGYCARNWLWHISEALHAETEPTRVHIKELLYCMEVLFATRESQLVCMEAMFRFAGLASENVHEITTELPRILTWLTVYPEYMGLHSKLLSFSEDMDSLRQNFAKILSSNETVHEIWTGMTDFLSPNSLLNESPESVTTCKPAPPFTPHVERCILYAKISEVSDDGNTLAFATVWECTVSKAIVMIEKWDVPSRKRHASTFRISDGREPESYLPISFSPDLSILAMRNNLYRFSGTSTNARSMTDDCALAMSKLPAFPIRFSLRSKRDRKYKTIISRDNRALGLFRGIGFSFVLFDISNFFDPRQVWEVHFNQAAREMSIASSSTGNPMQVGKTWDPSVAFHPTKPVMAWSYISETRIESTRNAKEHNCHIVLQGIEDLKFSECGGFLYGISERKPVAFEVLKLMCNCRVEGQLSMRDSYISFDTPQSNSAWDQSTVALAAPVRGRSASFDGLLVPHAAREVTRQLRPGMVYSLQIKDGVHLRRMHVNGLVEERILARLPDREGSENVRIVWKVEQREGTQSTALTTSTPLDQLPDAVTFVMNLDHESSLTAFPLIYLRKLEKVGPWKQALTDAPMRFFLAEEQPEAQGVSSLSTGLKAKTPALLGEAKAPALLDRAKTKCASDVGEVQASLAVVERFESVGEDLLRPQDEHRPEERLRRVVSGEAWWLRWLQGGGR